jgi:hypothetical protein
MKINKLYLPSLFLIVLISCSVFAQEKVQDNAPGSGGNRCSCTDPVTKCSANITCLVGTPMCTCSSGGCTSYCSTGGGGDFYDGKTLLAKLLSVSETEIASVLTKSTGRTVKFTPYKENFKIYYTAVPETHWEILEYLSQNGELTINGADYRMWKKIREIVLADKVNICLGNASVSSLVNELSFFTGRKYQIISGNPDAKVNIEIKEMTIEGIIESLQRNNQVVIQ